MRPHFFSSPGRFRAYLEAHHSGTEELWVGFHKRGSGKASITWPESVDIALCFGWIDGVWKSLDENRYVIRFTPRKPRSRWSDVNVRRAEALIASGMMHPAGLKAFEARLKSTYSYEQRSAAKLDAASERFFRQNPEAWQFFQAQPNWYRRTAAWWIISAKKPETRMKRLRTLIADSAAGRTIGPLTRPKR